jgi:hypothetical protein
LDSPAGHHQVVAIGYEIEVQGRAESRLSDPNHPRSVKTLRLITDREQESIEAESTTGRGLRGFVVWTVDQR